MKVLCEEERCWETETSKIGAEVRIGVWLEERLGSRREGATWLKFNLDDLKWAQYRL